MSKRDSGQVIAAHGRQYLVELAGGETLLCFPRGKKSDIACGDRVEISRPARDQGAIEAITPRSSLLYRSNEFRQKLIAANVTQVLVVVATEPGFSFDLVCRTLVAAQAQDVAARILLNKCDLTDKLETARQALAPFIALGVPVLELSAREGAEPLRPLLAGHTSLLVGQSGMGKSTLVNALIPEARAATREISEALDSGKHTTTHARLYHLDPALPEAGDLIDSPGLQDFGLQHLTRGEIEHAFPELHPVLGHCRFRDCRHDREPDCALRNALDAGQVDPRRWSVFRALYQAASS
ncbi:putative ribosome biogenesis GTPase RsgA [Azospira sp. I13]|uniref:ribosome small subunit-dependent GTPase A n=1 Tax=Azospira sp. I13 TaxID=1765050 RepID=UPI000D4A8A02|nr:ribosome small subunit-dependent GTPase A [Azospira sp. I13]GBG00923.1 putative ribosome biogenesis GTPase RsgA [Azospira sp. I13]